MTNKKEAMDRLIAQDADLIDAPAMTDDTRSDALREALSEQLTDTEIEDALVSEGIHTWGPDGERFERMFAVVMRLRAALAKAEGQPTQSNLHKTQSASEQLFAENANKSTGQERQPTQSDALRYGATHDLKVDSDYIFVSVKVKGLSDNYALNTVPPPESGGGQQRIAGGETI